MARGFLGAIVKVSKAIDAANKRATREAEKQHNQAVRMQKVAEKEYLANLRRQEQEDERRLKYNSLMEKKYQQKHDKRLKEQQSQAIKTQKIAEKEYLANLKKQEQENHKRLKEAQVLEKKLSREEEIHRKEQFDKQMLKAKNLYDVRCEKREALRESYIRKILK